MNSIELKILVDEVMATDGLQEEAKAIFEKEGQSGLDLFLDGIIKKNLPGGGVDAWKQSPDLRREFGENYDSYLAYLKAEASGRIKISGGKIIR